ncbi:hypothetical protein BV898_10351 [Hypsibius exemplaris]|uniref:HTH psq-type domain-containing protein n=1 Tax=Hypsibius exemplaris TaxID=2072580 RepID=A0A1W0WJX5_HYPEX|nr:hypothetical protein BV898_10351 [Hypsibius exemplaris]
MKDGLKCPSDEGASESLTSRTVHRMLRELELMEDKPSLIARSTDLTIGHSHQICDNKSTFRCIMERIPTDLCHSPFRCQRKLHSLRKTLRKTTSQVTCATGLELAVSYIMGSIRMKDRNSVMPRNRRNVKDGLLTRREQLFHSTAFLPTISYGTDWSVEGLGTCVFCVANADPRGGYILPPAFSEEANNIAVKRTNTAAASPLVVPITTESVPPPPVSKKNGKKGHQRKYSPAELRSAIDEVECGRVGTRKAAIIFGIPRSTLRNKVGKLSTHKCSSSNVTTPAQIKPRSLSKTAHSSPGLKRAASADLTSALKEIISRHITEKSKADEQEREREPLSYKRGRYRRYDKGDLEEALKAVRKGDMTVHRAGHFYGIPHSTLEYKIKERNFVTKNPPGTGGEKTSASSSSPPTSPVNTFSPGEVKKEPVAPVQLSSPVQPQTQTATFHWSSDTFIPGLNFGLTPLFFPSPFCDLLAGLSAPTATLTGSRENTMAILPLFTASTTLHPGESPFVGPFRPWVPALSSSDITTISTAQPPDITSKCYSTEDSPDEPLDLIKKDPVDVNVSK